MIKKLQALRAKKGFTLVELVVVIAIIGVLAAILVPTMIGVVQDSNITAADSTANQIKTQTTTFLTKMDTAKLGLKGVTSSGAVLTITVDNDSQDANGNPVWTVTCSEANAKFGDGNKATWSGGNDLNYDYALFMADSLRDLKYASITVTLKSGACTGAAVIEGKSDPVPNDIDVAAFDAGSYSFTGSKAGLMDDGTIIGTNPKLQKA